MEALSLSLSLSLSLCQIHCDDEYTGCAQVPVAPKDDPQRVCPEGQPDHIFGLILAAIIFAIILVVVLLCMCCCCLVCRKSCVACCRAYCCCCGPRTAKSEVVPFAGAPSNGQRGSGGDIRPTPSAPPLSNSMTDAEGRAGDLVYVEGDARGPAPVYPQLP